MTVYKQANLNDQCFNIMFVLQKKTALVLAGNYALKIAKINNSARSTRILYTLSC